MWYKMFTKLTHTTLTAKALLSGLTFTENEAIKLLEPNENIVLLKCNYGVKVFPSYEHLTEPKKVSKRGRKRLKKVKTNKTEQGSGECFNSQITLWVKSRTVDKKYYRAKVFRNGCIIVPGGICPDMSDIKMVLNTILTYIKQYYGKHITLGSVAPTMINYRFRVADESLIIRRLELIQTAILLHGEKTVKFITYNPQRYQGISIRVSTPTEEKPDKMTAVVIFNSGKINIAGALKKEHAEMLYEWLAELFEENATSFLIKQVVDSESESSESDNIALD